MSDSEPKAASVKPPEDATDDAPKGSGPRIKKPDSKPKGKPQGRPESLEKQIEQFFYTIGIVLSPINGFDGMAVMLAAEVNAKAHASLCRKNARIKAGWEKLLAAGALGEIATASAAIIIPIAINHGVIPPNVPMPKDWPQPPIQLAWIEQQRQRAAGSNGQG